MPEAERAELLEAELRRGRELMLAGHIKRIWRIPGGLRNVGIWDATDATELHQMISSLPLFDWFAADVTPLAEHPTWRALGRLMPAHPQTAEPNASPVARRTARAEGLDLTQISGSGPGGRIVKRDVELVLVAREAPGTLAPSSSHRNQGGPPAPLSPLAPAGPTDGAHETPEPAKGEAKAVELSKLQGTLARRMAESRATAPRFSVDRRCRR